MISATIIIIIALIDGGSKLLPEYTTTQKTAIFIQIIQSEKLPWTSV
jgi:hypothetical protein